MEKFVSLESIRDITVDIFHAGKVACASVIEKLDEKLCNSINTPEDEK